MTARFFLLGDVMVDVTAIVSGPINYASDTPARVSLQPGGAAANTACWLAHDGEIATLVGSVGADLLGVMVEAHLSRLGVRCALTTIDESATGTCIIIVDSGGERTMLPDAGANSALTSARLPTADFNAGDHLHVSGYTLLNPATHAVGMSALRAARAAGLTTSLDPASAAPLARDPSVLDDALSLVDILLANDAEAAVLTGLADPVLALDALAERVPTVIVKRAALGAIARSSGILSTVDAAQVPVVDTTGAGDAFAAGFLPSWVAGHSLPECLRRATLSAGRAVARVGAGPGDLAPGE